MNVFPLVFMLCIGIIMQSMRINGLVGMSIRYLQFLNMKQIWFLLFSLLLEPLWCRQFESDFSLCHFIYLMYFSLQNWRELCMHVFLIQRSKGKSPMITGPACTTLWNYDAESLKAKFYKKCTLKPKTSVFDGQWWLSMNLSEGSWDNIMYSDEFDPLTVRGKWEASEERAGPVNIMGCISFQSSEELCMSIV